jgi:enoyl-[acyl-carrier protein] reductase I
MRFYGAEKVVESNNLMGPVKAALEAATRKLAAERGPRNITVNALSPGPMAWGAASGIANFNELWTTRWPARRSVAARHY